jgi:hypothetical protein
VEKAKKLYGKKKNYSHIFQIQQELQLIKQQPNQIISELFSLLQEKIDALKLSRPPTYDSEEIQRREKDSSYETVRSHILLASELPLLDAIMTRVEGEETRRAIIRSQPINDRESKALNSYTRNQNQNPRTETRRA